MADEMPTPSSVAIHAAISSLTSFKSSDSVNDVPIWTQENLPTQVVTLIWTQEYLPTQGRTSKSDAYGPTQESMIDSYMVAPIRLHGGTHTETTSWLQYGRPKL